MTQQSTCPRPPAEPAAAAPGAPDHVRMGVGARFTLHPAADDFIPVILGALEAARAAAPEVTVRTDDVSTLLRGSEEQIGRFLLAAVDRAAELTPSGHVVATLALSRGCPGEVGCTLPTGELAHVAPVSLAATGRRAAAHWALYPLGTEDAMGPIEQAIAAAQAAGTWSGPENFATRLDGDLGEVLSTLLDTWTVVGRSVAHVAAHATVSLGSPTATPTSGPAVTRAGEPR
ncbi:hypothetical protein J4G33_09000 [Actinotalea sp. BY-33]|uniref:Thiamin/hydroxymethyl pyrimidine-binding YkoF putative domain-containing protein n=1 Tax=Actinotalea soli TaxID=2819234 RepID=A0A939LTP6_9CELL|nr:YkoF family thiamine/hydroxymethylpyrimidine-binding protein [Actinotalea soli]MBO1751939.1 hypothetical protein [Actinotalea soli]